ncbi:hypothetical protein ACJX0J_033836, partial [Zea mays]
FCKFDLLNLFTCKNLKNTSNSALFGLWNSTKLAIKICMLCLLNRMVLYYYLVGYRKQNLGEGGNLFFVSIFYAQSSMPKIFSDFLQILITLHGTISQHISSSRYNHNLAYLYDATG